MTPRTHRVPAPRRPFVRRRAAPPSPTRGVRQRPTHGDRARRAPPRAGPARRTRLRRVGGARTARESAAAPRAHARTRKERVAARGRALPEDSLSLGALLGKYLSVGRGATDGDASARAARDVVFLPALYCTLHAQLYLSPDFLHLGATELLAGLTERRLAVGDAQFSWPGFGGVVPARQKLSAAPPAFQLRRCVRAPVASSVSQTQAAPLACRVERAGSRILRPPPVLGAEAERPLRRANSRESSDGNFGGRPRSPTREDRSSRFARRLDRAESVRRASSSSSRELRESSLWRLSSGSGGVRRSSSSPARESRPASRVSGRRSAAGERYLLPGLRSVSRSRSPPREGRRSGSVSRSGRKRLGET